MYSHIRIYECTGSVNMGRDDGFVSVDKVVLAKDYATKSTSMESIMIIPPRNNP